jgi:DNA polymerase-1
MTFYTEAVFMTTQKLLLIDGSSYFYRAFHALPPLKNSKGQATGAVYGVVAMIKKLIATEKPDYLAVVFDAKGPTFRHHLYDQYKAHRAAMPDELVSQIAPLHELIKALGLPLLCETGVEADDVIGSLAKEAEKENISVVISTGDKDLAQLVNDHITLVNTMSNTVYDRAGVIAKFGVPPEKIIDYLSLVGDTSDNVPGVPGCGPKTAVKWLTEFVSLDNIIAQADKITGKVGENLRAALPLIPLSKELVTLKCDVELVSHVTDLIQTEPNLAVLKTIYQELELKVWLKELVAQPREATPSNSPLTGGGLLIATPLLESIEIGSPPVKGELEGVSARDKNYQLILTQTEFETYLAKLQAAPLFAIDLETTSLNYIDTEIVGISFSIEAKQAVYIPLAHSYEGVPQQLNRETILQQLKHLLENPKPQKIGQHIKYDMNVLAQHGIHLQGLAFDTMMESYVLNSTASRHDLGSLALHYLGASSIPFDAVAGSGRNQVTFDKVPLDKALAYSAEDSDLTLQLHQKLWPQLEATPALVKLVQDIEIPLIAVLSKMECTGVLIDSEKLAQLSQDFSTKMEQLSIDIFREAGQEFNIDSPKQLQVILFEKMGLPIIKKTPKGQPSTAEPILQELALYYPLPAFIMEYRSCAKLKSTYTDKLPTLVNARTGRVHTSYHQGLTSTGRLSSSDPNLQNIPIKNAEGRAIRQAFIAAPGYSLISADYSQVELRIMAHLSNDVRLVEAFSKGEDIHRATAAEVMGMTPADVTDEQRRHAKAVNFGLIYGMSAFGLSKQLKVPRYQAQNYIETYFARYPGVKEYMDRTRQLAREQGYVETLSGRRLYLPGINDRNKMLQQAAERAAINAPMQGTAADIIKIAMINLDRKISELKVDAKIIMQVHDELVVEVRDDQIEKAREIIQQAMSQAMTLKVPLVVDISVGKNWGA